jgi:hypothetical protein
MAQDTNAEYWSEYTNLQHVKHELIREYLRVGFPSLAFGVGVSCTLIRMLVVVSTPPDRQGLQ